MADYGMNRDYNPPRPEARNSGVKVPFHDDGEPEEDFIREGLKTDLDRNDKFLEQLRSQLEVLYDKLMPILGQERSSEDSNAKIQAEEQYSELREHVLRQGRQIRNMTSLLEYNMDRIEI